MAYKQKSGDIQNNMRNMKSSSNYGGESVQSGGEKWMSPDGTVHSKPKELNYGNFSYKGIDYSMDNKNKTMSMGGTTTLESDMHYKKASKKYHDTFQLAMSDYDTKLNAYNKAISSSNVKSKPAAKINTMKNPSELRLPK